MHASDFPDVGSFSAVEATWTIPEVAPTAKGSEDEAPYVSHGVALCCGDECSTRLSVGMQANTASLAEEVNDPYTAEPMFQLSPQFGAARLSNYHNFSGLILCNGHCRFAILTAFGEGSTRQTFFGRELN
jgi:hypothetical protein